MRFKVSDSVAKVSSNPGVSTSTNLLFCSGIEAGGSTTIGWSSLVQLF